MCNNTKMRELLSVYLDGQLSQQEKIEVDVHLNECNDCKKYYAQLQSLRKMLSKYAQEELSPDSEQRIKNDFLGGKLKRETIMKNKILVSAGSVALTLVLVFAFAVQPMMKRGISGRLKDSTDKIAGGTAYSAGGTSNSVDVYEGDASRTAVTRQDSESILKNAGTATNGFRWGNKDGAYRYTDTAQALLGFSSGIHGKSLDSAKTSTFNYEAYGRPLALSGSFASQSAAPAPGSVQVYPEYSDVPVVIVEPYLPQSGNGEKVIYSAAVYIKVKDAQAAYDRAAQITRENKGFLGSTNFSQTSDGKALANMTLRVPREKFEAVLNALRTLGDVKGINSSNMDISQQYQELTQQLNNIKVIYDKMVDSLKDKKTDIEKAQRMENALTPYLHRIEALKRQLAVYDNQIAMSTITVALEESSLHTFLKHDFEDIHEQAIQKTAAALKSLALMVPAFIAFAIALACALAAWNTLRNNFLKK